MERVHPPRTTTFMRLALLVALSGLSLWQSTGMVADKIPALATIPTTLPDAERKKFTQQKQTLEIQLSKFEAAARAFNAKAAENQNDGEYNALQAQRTDYV